MRLPWGSKKSSEVLWAATLYQFSNPEESCVVHYAKSRRHRFDKWPDSELHTWISKMRPFWVLCLGENFYLYTSMKEEPPVSLLPRNGSGLWNYFDWLYLRHLKYFFFFLLPSLLKNWEKLGYIEFTSNWLKNMEVIRKISIFPFPLCNISSTNLLV